MQQTCRQCRAIFDVTDDDLAFYDRVSPVFGGKKYLIPPPTFCPMCRQQLRLYHKNFFRLYVRNSSKSDRKVVSMYRPDAAVPVYAVDEWWSDSWQGQDYGQDIDMSTSILGQISALSTRVPHIANVVAQSENCDYCNFCFESKNSYLVSGCVKNEECLYGHIVWFSRGTVDSLYSYRCEYCYECVGCSDCYNVRHARDASNCSDSSFLDDCTGCRNCFGCVGLHSKEHHIFNVPCPAKEYLSRVATLFKNPEVIRKTMDALQPQHIVKAVRSTNAENVSGNYLYNCKNVRHSFDLQNSEDCAYCTTLSNFTDAMDIDFAAIKTELAYNSLTSYGQSIVCCANCMSVGANLTYCDNCFSCKDCFGCVGLKNARYCILNRQHTREEYERLVPPIITKMQEDGEWGEFFPVAMSPFAYNETMAQAYFPLTKEQAVQQGFQWSDYEAPPPHAEKVISAEELPHAIDTVSDDILQSAIQCEVTGKPFKIIKQELDFYRHMQLPLPHLHPDERHRWRMAQRNPRKLWDRQCAKCGKGIQTSYASERPEIIYCEECYLKEVY